MVFNYKIIPVKKEILSSSTKIKGFSTRRKTVTRRFRKDRRRLKLDRRGDVRDGVIVSLSSNSNRRNGVDRRRVAQTFVPPDVDRGVVV